MADYDSTVDAELSELGIVSSYIFKPQRMFARRGNEYISIDVVADGSAKDVSDAVYAEGQRQIAALRTLADEQKADISKFERDYATVRASLASSYRQMYNYFMGQGLVALGTIMATAIVNLSMM